MVEGGGQVERKRESREGGGGRAGGSASAGQSAMGLHSAGGHRTQRATDHH